MTERRYTDRATIELACTLRRRTGSAISARTVDIGPGGMRVWTPRPLASDEVLSFDIRRDADVHISGRARVLRHESHNAYALRFEALLETARLRLEELAAERSRRV
jgi:hypothetical protein